MEEAWCELKASISLANRINKSEGEIADFNTKLKASLKLAVARCRSERKRKLAEAPVLNLDDESMRRAARYTDNLPLADYGHILHLVPRLVNIVTLAEAVPVPGSGITLPLDLHTIGARCTNAYYAPKRFAAVQLAFSNPRCRVLIFHTGRLVGTGCSGPMAARMAIMKAARQLAVEANVHVHVRKFSVINQVGAVGIDAKLDCDAFASTHSATSHYDRASFVGLAWRPGGEHICCGALHTIQSNLNNGPSPKRRTATLRVPVALLAIHLVCCLWQRSTPRARPTCPVQRGSATCSCPLRAWSPSCCATATVQTCASSYPSICASAIDQRA
tara:strand:- start:189 stop:1181 length:993 start_codon:yes stop_codon:yes gene_type:complete